MRYKGIPIDILLLPTMMLLGITVGLITMISKAVPPVPDQPATTQPTTSQSTTTQSTTTPKERHWTMTPFWTSTTMEGESLLFIAPAADQPARAELLFTPEKILSVKSATGQVTYEEGRDYTFTPGQPLLTLPKGSRIPFKTEQELFVPKGAPNSFGQAQDHPDQGMLFSEGSFFHKLQVEVSYTHASQAWAGPKPAFVGEQLPRTLARLRAHEPLTLAILGDSISVGGNASGYIGAPPAMPPYGKLVAQGLQDRYGSKITLKNFSVGGKAAYWGIEQSAKVAAEKPDLVFLAFGMNDGTGSVKATEYAANIQKQIRIIRQANPQAEFVLVGTMLANPEWAGCGASFHVEYRDALAKLAGPGIVFADVTGMWAELLKHKRFVSLTGNGINHPNDFGHRVYAQTILAMLSEK